MNKIENYLGVANHDIQMTNNSQELKSYVASILCENDELQQENQKYKEVIEKIKMVISARIKAYKDTVKKAYDTLIRQKNDVDEDFDIEQNIKLEKNLQKRADLTTYLRRNNRNN